MDNEDLCGFDRPDYPDGDTCLSTGQTFAELTHYNVGTDAEQDWQPFISEDEYRWWMRLNDRPIPILW